MKGALNNPYRPGYFTKNETRDATAVTGDVVYTGYGFKPKFVTIRMVITATTCESDGAVAGVGSDKAVVIYWDGSKSTSNAVCKAQTSAIDFTYANLKTFDVDGFTLTWLKTGNPSGIMLMQVRAFR